MEITWTKTIEELKQQQCHPKDKIYFTCTKCHKLQSLLYKTVIKRDIFICRACRGVETQLRKHKEDPTYRMVY